MLLAQPCDQLWMRTETANMKPNEPSRTALMIARQRAAHQVLDHGSILYDPFAMKILREDEKDVLQFANAHPLASIGRMLSTLSTNLPARSNRPSMRG
jgi:O-methyltransferase involved in polyketide biosynthesis